MKVRMGMGLKALLLIFLVCFDASSAFHLGFSSGSVILNMKKKDWKPIEDKFQLNVLRRVGSGSSGEAYLAKHQKDSKYYIVKARILDGKEEDTVKDWQDECATAELLQPSELFLACLHAGTTEIREGKSTLLYSIQEYGGVDLFTFATTLFKQFAEDLKHPDEIEEEVADKGGKKVKSESIGMILVKQDKEEEAGGDKDEQGPEEEEEEEEEEDQNQIILNALVSDAKSSLVGEATKELKSEEKGDKAALLKKVAKIWVDQVLAMTLQLLTAVTQMTQKKFIHHDIKPENLVVSGLLENNGVLIPQIKLIDLGGMVPCLNDVPWYQIATTAVYSLDGQSIDVGCCSSYDTGAVALTSLALLNGGTTAIVSAAGNMPIMAGMMGLLEKGALFHAFKLRAEGTASFQRGVEVQPSPLTLLLKPLRLAIAHEANERGLFEVYQKMMSHEPCDRIKPWQAVTEFAPLISTAPLRPDEDLLSSVEAEVDRDGGPPLSRQDTLSPSDMSFGTPDVSLTTSTLPADVLTEASSPRGNLRRHSNSASKKDEEEEEEEDGEFTRRHTHDGVTFNRKGAKKDEEDEDDNSLTRSHSVPSYGSHSKKSKHSLPPIERFITLGAQTADDSGLFSEHTRAIAKKMSGKRLNFARRVDPKQLVHIDLLGEYKALMTGKQ